MQFLQEWGIGLVVFDADCIFVVKKKVPIPLYKVCWNKCSVARLRVCIFKWLL